jgi:hypothetical protein
MFSSGEHAQPKPRADTAQSWHQILGASQRAQSGNRRVAIAVAVAGVLVALVATVAIVGSHDGPDAALSPASSESGAAVDQPAAEETDEEPETAPASAASTAPAEPTASASAEVAEPPRPAGRPRPRAVRPKPKPPVVRSRPKRPKDIFSDR